MKHLKIFEEFNIEPGEKFEEVSFTANELNYLKLNANLYKSYTEYFINGMKIIKISDSWYIIAESVKASSIQDAIKVSKNLYNEIETYIHAIIPKMDIERDDEEDESKYLIDGEEYIYVSQFSEKVHFKVRLCKNISRKFNIDIDSAGEIIKLIGPDLIFKMENIEDGKEFYKIFAFTI